MADSPRQVLVINEATVVFADDEAGLALGDSYGCVVTSAQLVPTPNLVDVPATGCAPKSQTPAATSWNLELAWLQDWNSPGGGLAGFAFENDTALKWFEVTPVSPALPSVTGELRVVAGQIFGAFGELLVATASWPVQGKPAITLPVAAGALELEGDELEGDPLEEGDELELEDAGVR